MNKRSVSAHQLDSNFRMKSRESSVEPMILSVEGDKLNSSDEGPSVMEIQGSRVGGESNASTHPLEGNYLNSGESLQTYESERHLETYRESTFTEPPSFWALLVAASAGRAIPGAAPAGLHEYWAAANVRVALFQRLWGISAQEPKPANSFGYIPYILFRLGSLLGEEAFYVLVLPAMLWVANVPVCRRWGYLWITIYYIGQLLKDMLRMPRPSGPAIRILRNMDCEYGLPSTHTMGALSTTLFFAVVLPQANLQLNLWASLAAVIGWTLLVALSRVYFGVHYWEDLFAGASLALGITLTYLYVMETVFSILTYPWLGPLVELALLTTCLVLYPTLGRIQHTYSTTFGDVCYILGVMLGVDMALPFLSYDTTIPLYMTGPPRSLWFLHTWQDVRTLTLRVLIGYPFVGLFRMLIKTVVLHVLVVVLGLKNAASHCNSLDELYKLPERGLPLSRRYLIEGITKTLMHAILCFVAGFLWQLFPYIGLAWSEGELPTK